MAGTERQGQLLNDIARLEDHGREAAITLTALSHSPACSSEHLKAASDVAKQLFAVVGLLPALRGLLENAALLFTPTQLETLQRHVETIYSVCISIDDARKPVHSSTPNGLQKLLSGPVVDRSLTSLGLCFRELIVVLYTIRATQLEENDQISDAKRIPPTESPALENGGSAYALRESRQLREALTHPEYSASASLTHEAPPQALASARTDEEAADPFLSSTPPREVIELQHPPGFRGRYGHPDYPLAQKRAEVYISPPDPDLHFNKSFEEAEVERQQLRDQGRYPDVAAFGIWPPRFIAPNSIQDHQLRTMSDDNNDVAPQSSTSDTPIDTPASTRDGTPIAGNGDINDSFENIQLEDGGVNSVSSCATSTPGAMSQSELNQATGITSEFKGMSISQNGLGSEGAGPSRIEAEVNPDAGSQDEPKGEDTQVIGNNADLAEKAASLAHETDDSKQKPAAKEASLGSERVEERLSTTSLAQEAKTEQSTETPKATIPAALPQAKDGAQSSTATSSQQPQNPQFGAPSGPSLFGGCHVPLTISPSWDTSKNLEAYTLQAVSKDIFDCVQWTFETELLSLGRASIYAHLWKLGPNYSVIDAAAQLLPEERRLINLRAKDRGGYVVSAEYGKPSTMNTKMGTFEVKPVFFIIETSKSLDSPVKKDFLGNPVPYRENHSNGIFGSKTTPLFGFGKIPHAAPSNRADYFYHEKDALGEWEYQSITAHPAYQKLSFEELRLKEESAKKPYADIAQSGPLPTSTATPNPAAETWPRPAPFGTAPAPLKPFATGLFGQPQSTSGFGSTAKPSTGLFGQPQSTSGFGATVKPSTGLFGQPQSTSNSGSTTRPSTGPFGKPQPASSSGSNPKPSTGLFGQPQSTSSPGNSTKPSTGLFGHPQPALGSGNTAKPSTGLFASLGTTPSTSGGLLGGAAPKVPHTGVELNSSTARSLDAYGYHPKPSGGSLFGSNSPVTSSSSVVNQPLPLLSDLLGNQARTQDHSGSNSPLFGGGGGASSVAASPLSSSLFGSALKNPAPSRGLFGGAASSKPTSSTSSSSGPQQPTSGSILGVASGSSSAAPSATKGFTFFSSTLPTTTPPPSTSSLFSTMGASPALEANCRECKTSMLFHSDRCRRTGVCLMCRPAAFGSVTCRICHRDDSKPNPQAALSQSSSIPFGQTGLFGVRPTGSPAPASDISEGGGQNKAKSKASVPFPVAHKGAPGFEKASSQEEPDL